MMIPFRHIADGILAQLIHAPRKTPDIVLIEV